MEELEKQFMEDPEYQGLAVPEEPLNQSASQAMATGAGQLAATAAGTGEQAGAAGTQKQFGSSSLRGSPTRTTIGGGAANNAEVSNSIFDLIHCSWFTNCENICAEGRQRWQRSSYRNSGRPPQGRRRGSRIGEDGGE